MKKLGVIIFGLSFLLSSAAYAKDTTASMSLGDSLNPPAADPQEG